MKIPINLASQPFRRDRALLVASIAVSLLLVATLSVLISLSVLDRSQLADVRQDVNQLDKEIRKATSQQAALEAVLRRPENTEVIERSVMLNELLYRKGISWTRILADLEKTMPYNVRLMSIRPFVNRENQVTLDMQVGGETQGAVIEFLKSLESSSLFESPAVPSSQAPTQSEPLFRSRVVVNYAQRL